MLAGFWKVKALKAGFQFGPQIAKKHCGRVNFHTREGKKIF